MMDKKFIINTKIIFIFILVSSILLLVSGCKKQSVNNDEINLGVETGEEQKLSSSNYINDLLNNEKISTTNAALIELTLAYSPNSLPNNIKSEETIPSIMWAENYVANNWDSFSNEEKEKLLPFYVLPDDSRSVHYNEDSKTKAVAEALTIIQSVIATDNLFSVKSFKIDSQRKALVTYKNNTANNQQADWIGASFIYSYTIHENLLGVKPENEIKIYIIDMASYGSAVMKNDGGVQKCIIQIKSGLDKKMTEATLTHELFHCFQFAIPLKYEKKDMMWLMEATATWAEHNTYPSHNSEWEYHDYFFKNLGGNMLYYGENRQYGTYTWILYLSQKNGVKTVKDLLMQAKSVGATNAVLTLSNYDELFKEFGYYSWNQEIAHKLNDNPDFPKKWDNGIEKKPYNKKSYYKINTNKGIEQDLGFQLSVFSHYYVHMIVDSTVKKIEFKMDPVPDNKHPVQVLIKTKEGWYYEDFEGEKEKYYCIQEDSKIEEIVLIMSNSQKESFKPKIILSTKETCEPQWNGYYKVTWTAQKIDNTEGPGGSATITNYVEGTYISHEILKYDEEKGDFNIMSAQVNYESTTKKHIDYGGDDCEKYDYEDGVMSGSYNYDFKDASFPPLRMRFEYGDSITGPLSFDVNPVTKQEIKWIHYSEKKNVLPCTARMGETPNPKITTFENDYSDVTLPPEGEEFLINVNPGDKKIKGEKTIKIYSDQYGEYDAKIEYSYSYE